MRSFRTVRGTAAKAERVLNGMLREADMGAGNYRPACSWEISWGVGRKSGSIPGSVLKPAAGMIGRCRSTCFASWVIFRWTGLLLPRYLGWGLASGPGSFSH